MTATWGTVPGMARKRSLIIQHEHDGPVAAFGDHLQARGYDLHVLQVMSVDSTESTVVFPDPTDFDVVVPLGSVHGVYEHDVIGTWIGRELAMLRAAHDANVPMFGICFGAQSIAAALGGRVEKAPGWEIGWYEYETTLPDVIGTGAWCTWHGDRFHLPEGVAPLASSPLCTQAYRVGRTAAVQFHPEVTPELITSWVSKCSPQYFAERAGSAEVLVGGFDGVGADVAKRAAVLFDWFLDDVAVS